jgi:hypothetical protein
MSFLDSASIGTVAWAQLSAVSDRDANYSIGVDFRLKASEQFPLKALEDRPLKALENKIERP